MSFALDLSWFQGFEVAVLHPPEADESDLFFPQIAQISADNVSLLKKSAKICAICGRKIKHNPDKVGVLNFIE